MFYQYSNITGRLVGNNNMLPYYPLSANPLSKNEPPKFIFSTANQKLAHESSRHVATQSVPKRMPGSSTLYGEVPQSLRAKMELFQRKDGVPIHLKGGASDRLLFGFTIGLCLIGIAGVLKMIVEMSFPKKKQ